MKVLLGNNLGYRLHSLISTNQTEERFSAGWTLVSGNKNVALNYPFSTIGFKDKNVYFLQNKRLFYKSSYACLSALSHIAQQSCSRCCSLDVACSRALIIPAEAKGKFSFLSPVAAAELPTNTLCYPNPGGCPVVRLPGRRTFFAIFVSVPSNNSLLFDSLPEPLQRYSH